MICKFKRPVAVLAAGFALVVMAVAQRKALTFSIQGYAGELPVVQSEGRLLVNVEDLARITNGSLSYKDDHVVLEIPHSAQPATAKDPVDQSHFSRPFMKAAIEAMASIREWGGALIVTVQNGYPVENTMPGNALTAYQGRAGDNVALASTAASTEADYRGLDLLKTEYNGVRGWADRFITARKSMSAANLTVSENGLKQDPEAQKLMQCGQFLEQMFASGSVEEDATCR